MLLFTDDKFEATLNSTTYETNYNDLLTAKNTELVEAGKLTSGSSLLAHFMGDITVTLEYMGNHETYGQDWYKVSVTGTLHYYKSGAIDASLASEEKTLYCMLFTNGRITQLGVTHKSSEEPEDVLRISELELTNEGTSLTSGASVRLDATPEAGGIRFQSNVNVQLYNDLKAKQEQGYIQSVELGTMIAPYKTANPLTEENFKLAVNSQGHATVASNGGADLALEGEIALVIAQTMWQDKAAGIYTAVMNEMPQTHYAANFAARGFVKVTYNDGTAEYFYSSFDKDSNVRSIQQVANTYWAAMGNGAQIDEQYRDTVKAYAGIS